MSTATFRKNACAFRKNVCYAACASALAMIAPVQQANAQAKSDKSVGRLEEVIVSARRIEENVQAIPLAITVLDEAALEARNIRDPFDLQYLSPSLNISSGTAGSVTLRGQGQGALGAAPAVVGYMDEVVLNMGGSLAAVGIFDLQNVQIVKGPQGTLFGRNTTGGAILYTSKRPTDSFEGYIKAAGGNYDLRELEGAINLPITDSLALRLAGQSRQRDGYVENILAGTDQADIDQQAYRLGLQWQVTDSIENFLSVNYLKSNTNGLAFVLRDVRAGATTPVHRFYGTAFDRLLIEQQARGIRKIAAPRPDQADVENTQITDIVSWEINDAFTLKNIASYANNRFPYTRIDYDYTVYRLVDSESSGNTTQAKSNELQLQGSLFGDNLNFVVGHYYEHIEIERAIYSNQLMDAFLFGVPLASVSYQPDITTQDSQAIFTQMTYDLGDTLLEGLSVTGGVRRTWDERETERQPYVSSVRTGFNLVCNPLPPTGQPCLYTSEGKWAENTWTIGLDYHITHDAMVYIVKRRGYKAGGFNAIAPSPEELSFDPEYVTDIEVGGKFGWTLGGMAGRSNIAVYQSKFSEIQRTDSYLSSTSFTSFITNLADATINGVELEATLLPTDNLQLDLMYSYTDAGYDEYTDRAGVDRTDQPFGGVPETRVNARVSYTVPMDSSLGRLNLSADYSWQDEWISNPSDDLSSKESTVDSYSLVNARVQWSNAMKSGFDLGLFGTNLTDEDYVIGVIGAGATFGFTSVNYGPPRMWGVDVRYNFN